MKKYVYSFGNNRADGSSNMKNLLGGKGANLAEMTTLGIPVPPGFTITTDFCSHYYKNNLLFPKDFKVQANAAIKKTEIIMQKQFGDEENPLLFSVRSGARQSMPGMMETVLNVGLTSKTIPGLIKKTKNERKNEKHTETEKEGQERETEREAERLANGKTVPVERGWMP